jgi:hypothetical protein
MMLLHMQNNSFSRSDAHTSSEDIIIVEVLHIGMTQPEAVVIKTPKIDTVELVNKEIAQLPLVQDVVVSDDVECPVVVEELCEEVRVLASTRRRRFAST